MFRLTQQAGNSGGTKACLKSGKRALRTSEGFCEVPAKSGIHKTVQRFGAASQLRTLTFYTTFASKSSLPSST